MSNKVYILQKELPDSKPGDKYIWNESMKAYFKNGDVQDSNWQSSNVENNPEWFKEDKPERIAVNDIGYKDENKHGIWYTFSTSERIDPMKYDAIKIAIEFVINGGKQIYFYAADNNDINIANCKIKGPIYTQEQIDKAREDAFNMAREKADPLPEPPRIGNYFKYPTFQDYLNSINQLKP